MNNKIAFGGSCHWCTEAIFQSLHGVNNVLQGWVSSIGEDDSFSEAVIVEFNDAIIPEETLIEVHLHTHSSTGNHSMRKKYRSAIYYYTEAQKISAERHISFLQKEFGKNIITQVLPFIDFKLNKNEFLNYYYENPTKPFCENVINPKLRILLNRFLKSVNTKKLNHLIESKLCLGTAAIGRPLYINVQNNQTQQKFNKEQFRQEGLTLLKEAVGLGIKHFDSSPGYGMAEELLVEFIKDKAPGQFTISTKWGYTYVADYDPTATKHEIKDHSIQKLNEQWEFSKQLLPFLNLYQIHSVTHDSTVLDDIAVLNRLFEIKKESNIEIGLSTSGANQNEVIKKALQVTVNKEKLFTSFQVTFNLLDQSLLLLKNELKDHKLIIKEALANGRILSERFEQYQPLQTELKKLAAKYDTGNDAIALRYCMDSFRGSTVLSGANNKIHLSQNIKANNFRLEKKELDKLSGFSIPANDYWIERKKLNWN